MPIFEFNCKGCGKPFEELVPSSSAIASVTCPTCGSPDIEKKISRFASKSSGSSFSLSGASSSSSSNCSTGST